MVLIGVPLEPTLPKSEAAWRLAAVMVVAPLRMMLPPFVVVNLTVPAPAFAFTLLIVRSPPATRSKVAPEVESDKVTASASLMNTLPVPPEAEVDNVFAFVLIRAMAVPIRPPAPAVKLTVSELNTALALV